MAFRAPMTIRFGDVDPAGIVYYPRYLHFCHVAMEEFFGHRAGIPYSRLVAGHTLGFPTVHLDVDYHRPLRYGDEIAVQVEIESIGASSLIFVFTMHRGEEESPVFRARVVTVAVDMQTFEKRAIPDWLREKLAPRP